MTGQRKKKKEGKRQCSNSLCDDCTSICCTDLAIPATKPRTKDEIFEMKWHLQYDTVSVCIRNRRWYLLIKGRCIYLDENNLCKIYDRRPDRCRRHNPPDCERFASWYDIRIDTPEELESYLRKEKRRKKRRKRK